MATSLYRAPIRFLVREEAHADLGLDMFLGFLTISAFGTAGVVLLG